MNVQRSFAMFLVSAGLLATSAGYAAAGNTPHKTPTQLNRNQRKPDPNSTRMQVARAQAKAELAGQITAQTKSASGWKAKYNLYVGCSNTPPAKTFSNIQDAVNAAYPYTSIHVCPGTYNAGGSNTGISVYTAFIEIVGVSPHRGAETVSCGSTAVPTDNSWGFYIGSSHDTVKNLTFNDCEYGAYIGDETAQKNNVVSNSWFNDDYFGVYTYYVDDTTIANSHFQSNLYGIFSRWDVNDVISGNRLEGDGTDNSFGIYVEYAVGAKVVGNTVSAADFGFKLDNYSSLATIENNHFDDNKSYGLILSDLTSGNRIEENWASNNGDKGFYVDDDNQGAAATPDVGPNVFLKNHAHGNANWDYFDYTAGYTGGDPSTNAGTADYYKGNKGTNASPSAILSH